jgi:dUTP pyrophosphatase
LIIFDEDTLQQIITPFRADTHLTSQGYDFSVDKIESMSGVGRLLLDDKTLPSYERADRTGRFYHLKPGQYIVTFEEHVNIPWDVCGFMWSRSTLLRMGASMQTAVWDAGYYGVGASLLLVSNPLGITIERGARIGQMIFHRLETGTKRPYNGQYQGGKRA